MNIRFCFVQIVIVSIFIISCSSAPAGRDSQKPSASVNIVPAHQSVQIPSLPERQLSYKDIDSAINNNAHLIINAIQSESKIAVLDIDSFNSEYGIFAAEKIIIALTKAKKFKVVDRDSLETLRKELNFQYSGEVSIKTAVSMGKFIGANIVITGSLYQRFDQVDFVLKILNVETAELIEMIPIPVWGN